MKFCFLLLLILIPIAAQSQESENKIEDEITEMVEDHPLRVGILRIAPRLIAMSGYDSNSVTSAVIVESDYFTSIAPGADVAMKLGHRGYFAVQEDVNFVYYNTQTALRDIYNTTNARLVTGSRKILLTVNGGYVSKVAPYNSEFDEPIQHTSRTAGANVEWALRRTTDLSFRYNYGSFEFQPVNDLPEDLPPPPDSRSYEFGGGISQEVGNKFNVDLTGSSGTVKIFPIATPETKSNFWRVLGGVSFKGRKLTGLIHAGFGQTDSTTPGANAFRDVVVDTDVTYLAGRRLIVGVFMQRRRVVSALLADNFLLNTEFGMHGSIPLVGRFFVDGRFAVGKNEYPQTPENPDITKDNYRTLEGGLNFELTEHVRIRGNGTYQKRDSNDPLLSKDRFTVGLGLVMEP